MESLIPIEIVTNKILIIRGHRVIVDKDLAALYGVATKVLNQAVKRNQRRFPSDFMFQLKASEKNELVTKCDRFSSLKHSSTLPFVFTEQGVAMLSSVLSSDKALEVNILIVRAFVQLRSLLSSHEDLRRKMSDLEGRQTKTEDDIQTLISAVNMLLGPPMEKPKKKIGFI